MDPEYSSGSMTKKRTRGLTKIGDLILARNQGRKILVEFNEKNQPIENFEKNWLVTLELWLVIMPLLTSSIGARFWKSWRIRFVKIFL